MLSKEVSDNFVLGLTIICKYKNSSSKEIKDANQFSVSGLEPIMDYDLELLSDLGWKVGNARKLNYGWAKYFKGSK